MPNNEGEKMLRVAESLLADDRIYVAGAFYCNYLQSGIWPRPNGYWSRTLDIYTCPRKPIYDAEVLNELLGSLAAGIQPTMKDDFYNGCDELNLGKLYFDETIGKVITTAVVELDPAMSVVADGELSPGWSAHQKEVLKQRTWVRLFPSLGHLTDAAAGDTQYSIPVKRLRHPSRSDVEPHTFNSLLIHPVVELN